MGNGKRDELGIPRWQPAARCEVQAVTESGWQALGEVPEGASIFFFRGRWAYPGHLGKRRSRVFFVDVIAVGNLVQGGTGNVSV